jgi:hypothetical protein
MDNVVTAAFRPPEARDLLALADFFAPACLPAWGPIRLLAVTLSFVFTWLFNNSGGSLIPGRLFHGLQNNGERFEVFVPALRGTDWELLSTLGLLGIGMLSGVLLWRQTRSGQANAAPDAAAPDETGRFPPYP